MTKTILIAFGIGVAIVAMVVATVFRTQKGAHLDLPGKILKVRSIGVEDNASVVVIDFRVTNPADYRFMTRQVTVTLVDAGGHETDGDTIPEIDAKRLFEGLPLLGPKYNPSLAINDVVPPHATQDRMIAARFELPDSAIAARKNILVKVEEVDGRANVVYRERP